MELIILGCGTSTGVPIVGCNCTVCRSDSPYNKRTRTSAAIRTNGGNTILIDTSPDLRSQALACGIDSVDAVLYTHVHADHTHGIDEIRVYNYLRKAAMDVYGSAEHISHIRQKFSYIFEKSLQRGGGKPEVHTHVVRPAESFELFTERIVPIELYHGQLLCIGWRIGDLAYLTDVNRIPEKSFELLEGVRLLVLGALRWTPHQTHFSISEAVETAERIGASRTLLTHLSHDVDYEELARKLPENILPAYDGLTVEL